MTPDTLPTTYEADQATIATLRKQIEDLEIESLRASTWAADNFNALHNLSRAVGEFAKGVYASPHAKNRVIGFRDECNAMVAEAVKLPPQLMSVETARGFYYQGREGRT